MLKLLVETVEAQSLTLFLIGFNPFGRGLVVIDSLSQGKFSPGLSSHPAKRLPIITELAPEAIALVISPEYLMPPSAIRGTPASDVARRQFRMAVICGTPAPVTTRVAQMEQVQCRL